GQAATRKAIDLLRQAEIDIEVVRLPEGGDPDEYIRNNPQGWREVVDQAVEVVDFYLSWVGSQHDLGTERGKQLAAEEILPLFILNNNSPQAQAMLFPKIANALQLDESELRKQARGMLRSRTQELRHNGGAAQTVGVSEASKKLGRQE